MTFSSENFLRFVPSQVNGLEEVSEALVYPDRLELRSAGQWVSFRFAEIARWPRPVWLRRVLSLVGFRPRWLPVADGDWTFITFYTVPLITLGLPADEPMCGYADSYIARIRSVISAGGYSTNDVG